MCFLDRACFRMYICTRLWYYVRLFVESLHVWFCMKYFYTCGYVFPSLFVWMCLCLSVRIIYIPNYLPTYILTNVSVCYEKYLFTYLSIYNKIYDLHSEVKKICTYRLFVSSFPFFISIKLVPSCILGFKYSRALHF